MRTDLPQQFAGVRAAVVGLGRSGVAAASLLLATGATVRLIDKDPARCREVAEQLGADNIQVQDRVSQTCGDHHPEQFAGLDLVVMSPGVAIAKIRPYLPAQETPDVLAEMELASRFVTAPMLAVTGTSGKTTTVSLIAKMLEVAGKRVFLGGNIGTPLSEFVLSGESAEVLVLEISSFQLQTCSTFHPKVGVFLNIAPNHLDYHADMEEYLQAKLQIFANQTPDDTAVIHAPLKDAVIGRGGVASRAIYFDERTALRQGKLLGAHNRANIAAAFLAAKEFGVTEVEAQAAIDAFVPLPHRLQPVAEIDGVLFVNDSKATTPDAMAAAISSLERPVRLLAGGVFKGGDLRELLPLIKKHVVQVGLFGANRDIFEAAWLGVVPITWDDTLEEATRRLVATAASGDAVLLSPATASFDCYANYVARGEDFIRIVTALQGGVQ